MPAVLVRALNGSGPSVLRTRLGSSRTRLQRVLASVHPVQLASARLPAAVFGGDLFASLGAHLAVALTPGGEPAAERGRHSHTWISPPARRERFGSDPDAASNAPQRGMSNVATDHRHATGGVVREADARSRRRDRVHSLPPIGTGTSADAHRPGEIAAAPADALPLPNLIKMAPHVSALVRQIQEYASRVRTNRAAAPAATTVSTPRLPPMSPSTATAAWRQSRDQMRDSAHDVLQRFTGLSAGERAADAPEWPLAPEAGPSRQTSRDVRDAGGDAVASPWALSDRIADVLRAQAREHGIDLT
jgi:hypothetical protein